MQHRTDALFQSLKLAIGRGTQRGHFFDQGVRIVIEQIEQNGSFTRQDASVLKEYRKELDFTPDQAAEFDSGLAYAQDYLSRYEVK